MIFGGNVEAVGDQAELGRAHFRLSGSEQSGSAKDGGSIRKRVGAWCLFQPPGIHIAREKSRSFVGNDLNDGTAVGSERRLPIVVDDEEDMQVAWLDRNFDFCDRLVSVVDAGS